jgi:Cyclic nucleotide-binding domain
MEHNELKRVLLDCADLAGLDEPSVALLLWRAQQLSLPAGTAIYAEGAPIDDTFCLLLSGYLSIDRAGVVLGEISDQQIFGEMAYFTSLHARSATVRVGSEAALILKFQMTPAEFASAPFSVLKRYLGLQAWDRFVSNSQSLPFLASPPASNSAAAPTSGRAEPPQ